MIYKTLNICSPWEHEPKGILNNKNHYKTLNLNIHDAAYTVIFRSPLCFEH